MHPFTHGHEDPATTDNANPQVRSTAFEGADPPASHALTWPPCRCGHTKCPDRQPEESADSPALHELRARVREINGRRHGAEPGRPW